MGIIIGIVLIVGFWAFMIGVVGPAYRKGSRAFSGKMVELGRQGYERAQARKHEAK
jgi:hypothetical protein